MNTSILRKTMMLVVLFAGYISVMGADCQDYCKDLANNTPCPLPGGNSLNGVCWDRACTSGGPGGPANKCGGKTEHDACAITSDITGVCIPIQNILRCVVVAEIEPVTKPPVPTPTPVAPDPCEGLADDTDCETSSGIPGKCQSSVCTVP